MAGTRKLKVFRTPIGFHDAYVAAPSRKAALEAWSSDADLFARGVAEEVSDLSLTAEPLANPGTIIKRLRGTAAEQIEAAGSGRAPKRAGRTGTTRKKPTRPSRDALDSAERGLEQVEQRHRAALDTIAEREAALRQERSALLDKQQAERAAARQARDEAAAAYEAALAAWRAG
jgi:hypothetical protein